MEIFVAVSSFTTIQWHILLLKSTKSLESRCGQELSWLELSWQMQNSNIRKWPKNSKYVRVNTFHRWQPEKLRSYGTEREFACWKKQYLQSAIKQNSFISAVPHTCSVRPLTQLFVYADTQASVTQPHKLIHMIVVNCAASQEMLFFFLFFANVAKHENVNIFAFYMFKCGARW